MMKASFRIAGLACALIIAGTASSKAQQVIYRGTTTVQWERQNYAGSGWAETRGTETRQEIRIYSLFVGTSYAHYTLDKKTMVAKKEVGSYPARPMTVVTGRGIGVSVEKHTQLNTSWAEDIPEVGDAQDIFHARSGNLSGAQSWVELPATGSGILAARKLSGFHTLASWSEKFGISNLGYQEGRFHQISNSKSTYKLDIGLTDQANAMGNSLPNAITVTDAYLASKGYAVVLVGLP